MVITHNSGHRSGRPSARTHLPEAGAVGEFIRDLDAALFA
jgi:hypothetical protein